MGWHGLLFLPCLTGQHGTKNGPQARAWAEGQARRPMRHGPQGTACLLGPIAIVPCRPVTVPCRAGPARCPGMLLSATFPMTIPLRDMDLAGLRCLRLARAHGWAEGACSVEQPWWSSSVSRPWPLPLCVCKQPAFHQRCCHLLLLWRSLSSSYVLCQQQHMREIINAIHHPWWQKEDPTLCAALHTSRSSVHLLQPLLLVGSWASVTVTWIVWDTLMC